MQVHNAARRSLTESPIRSKQDVLRHSLEQFFADPRVRDAVVDILEHRSPLSLRILDHLVTKYADEGPDGAGVVYSWTGPQDPERPPRLVDLSAQYAAYLKGNPKVLFDPFCRGEKMLLATDGVRPVIVDMPSQRAGVTTNIRQLNFFRWALEHGVIDYAVSHLAAIEAHMNAEPPDGPPEVDSKDSPTSGPVGGGAGTRRLRTVKRRRGGAAGPATPGIKSAPALVRASKRLKYVRGSFVLSFNMGQSGGHEAESL